MIEPIEELEKMKIQWYYYNGILFELVKLMKDRETVFLATRRSATQRCLKIHAKTFLFKNFERYKFFDQCNCYNVYTSVARLDGMPMFSFKPEEKVQQQLIFNMDYDKYLVKYDFVIDIDNPDLQQAYVCAKKVKLLFDKYQIMYSLKFSGKKGFHFTVLDENQGKKLANVKTTDKVELFRLFASELKLQYGLHDLDLKIYDKRRILKTAYSVVYPYYFVALPLTDDQFDNFSTRIVFLPTVMENLAQFGYRGLLTREGDENGLYNLLIDTAKLSIKRDRFNKLFKLNKDSLIDYIQKVIK